MRTRILKPTKVASSSNYSTERVVVSELSTPKNTGVYTPSEAMQVANKFFQAWIKRETLSAPSRRVRDWKYKRKLMFRFLLFPQMQEAQALAQAS